MPEPTTPADLEQHAERFAALAAPVRLRLLGLLHAKALQCGDPAACDLSARCCNVSELAQAAGVSLATASHHLQALRRAGLIRMEARGQHRFYGLDAAALRVLAAWLGGLGAATCGAGDTTL